ncbi:hypothetical protein ZIOFF_072979 [Zingiber officinale]|uniref:Uncharacterized protein n=1 Tax=Zingiber officinale TaxID=94328 RepID=A0A8J5C370_ZINOF|nr:hypothetical protein ZIOFF_072979 [Zingiber officinale]
MFSLHLLLLKIITAFSLSRCRLQTYYILFYVGKELNTQFLASVTSSGNGQLTTSSAIAPIPVLSSSSSMGSPLFWIGVGVGLSVIFQVVANRLKVSPFAACTLSFVDVSLEELFHNERSFMNEVSKASPMETQSAKEIQTNGTVKQNASSSTEQPDYRQLFNLFKAHKDPR